MLAATLVVAVTLLAVAALVVFAANEVVAALMVALIGDKATFWPQNQKSNILNMSNTFSPDKIGIVFIVLIAITISFLYWLRKLRNKKRLTSGMTSETIALIVLS